MYEWRLRIKKITGVIFPQKILVHYFEQKMFHPSPPTTITKNCPTCCCFSENQHKKKRTCFFSHQRSSRVYCVTKSQFNLVSRDSFFPVIKQASSMEKSSQHFSGYMEFIRRVNNVSSPLSHSSTTNFEARSSLPAKNTIKLVL